MRRHAHMCSGCRLVPLCVCGLCRSQSYKYVLYTDGIELILFLLLQIMLSYLSVVMLPVTITQIETGPWLEQLCDATADLSGCRELLSGNGS